MSTGLAPAAETIALNAVLSNVFVSLHTADPGNTGASEVSGGAYARQGPTAFTNSGGDPTTAAHTAIITFPTATASWGTVAFFGLWTAATGGVFLGSAAVQTAKLVDIGDFARFLANALQVTCQ